MKTAVTAATAADTALPPEARVAFAGISLAAANANVVMQLSRLPVGRGVAESRVPKLSSDGASLQDVKDTLLAQPGLSDSVKNLIRQFNQPTGNLPIPIPADMATAQSVTVQNGVKATAIGDNTGLGAGVIWIKGGVVYAVAGTISVDQAVAIANSL